MGHELLSYAGGNPASKFYLWLKKVDAVVDATYGLSLLDLSDYDYSSAFEDGVSPKSAARRAAKASGA